MAEDAAREFFAAIESEFIARRGTPFLLSPKDYAVAQRWFALGIPAADVCAGIADAFERREERGAAGRVNSLAYCEGAVLEAWERRASARVGHPGSAESAGDAGARLAELAGALDSVAPRFAAAVAGARRSLDRLAKSGKTAEEIEASLSRVEKKMLRDVEEGLADEEREAIRADVDRRLAGDAAAMEERALRRTRDVLARQRLRAIHRLPRLSLLS
ncbi:MAG TPA: hypothetical protein VKH46_02675 [Thermoanaerobaculia bacterium]|nr:hypothetical protein [Thermoanaerobaculia bacterium]